PGQPSPAWSPCGPGRTITRSKSVTSPNSSSAGSTRRGISHPISVLAPSRIQSTCCLCLLRGPGPQGPVLILVRDLEVALDKGTRLRVAVELTRPEHQRLTLREHSLEVAILDAPAKAVNHRVSRVVPVIHIAPGPECKRWVHRVDVSRASAKDGHDASRRPNLPLSRARVQLSICGW